MRSKIAASLAVMSMLVLSTGTVFAGNENMNGRNDSHHSSSNQSNMSDWRNQDPNMNHSHMGSWWNGDSRNRGAELTGDEETPPVDSDMSANFKISYQANRNRMPFTLTIDNGQDVTMAHLHCGMPGQAGPIVVTIMGDVIGGQDLDNFKLRSAIENDNILADGATCPTPITDLQTLKTAIDNGEVYVNVHTVAHPDGEVRAQL